MYTSNFSTHKRLKFKNAVSIAQIPADGYVGNYYYLLAPPKELLFGYKSGKISWDYFKKEYHRQVLSKLNPAYVIDEIGEDAVLLCHEPRGEPCHRHIVAEWLRNYGVSIKEYNEETDYVEPESKGWFD